MLKGQELGLCAVNAGERENGRKIGRNIPKGPCGKELMVPVGVLGSRPPIYDSI